METSTRSSKLYGHFHLQPGSEEFSNALMILLAVKVDSVEMIDLEIRYFSFHLVVFSINLATTALPYLFSDRRSLLGIFKRKVTTYSKKHYSMKYH